MNRHDTILKQLNEIEEQLKLGEILTKEESTTHLKICSKLMHLGIADKWGITQTNISAIKRGKITRRIYS